jgi:peptidoglycan/xylan/chitin deacetylase (PgdA/CDA1 family)
MPSRLPVLTFHSLEDRPSVISVPPGVFLRGLTGLHRAGYRTLSLGQVVDGLRRRAPFPARSFAITFDDGYETVYTEAFPVLQRHGLSATVFLTPGESGSARGSGRLPSLGGRPMLTWSQVREMQRAGIDFGAHTCTHPDLTLLPRDRVEAEIRDAKAILEEALEARVDAFAYPFGRFDHRSRDVVRQHFACACSDELGLVASDSDLYALERVDAYYLRTDRLFSVMRTRWFSGYLLARRIPRRIRRLIRRRLASLAPERRAP